VGVRGARFVEEEARVETGLDQSVENAKERGMGDREETVLERRESASVEDGEETGMVDGEERRMEGGEGADMEDGEEGGMGDGEEARVQNRMEREKCADLERNPGAHLEESVQARVGKGLGAGGTTPRASRKLRPLP